MNKRIELRHFRYLVALGECLHFTKAAERLGIAQPALSQQIQKLEEAVGCQLVERTTRGVKLTAAGALLVERARGTVEKFEEDLGQTRRIGRGEEGRLTIGFSGSAMLTQLPGAIEKFRRGHPRVELRLREMSTGPQLQALLEGSLDMGFLRDGDEVAGIGLRTLLSERYVVILPEGHWLARRKVIRPEELKGEPFLLYGRSCGARAFDRTMECCTRAGFYPEIVQEAPQWVTVIRLVAAGLGVSIAPECVATLAMPGTVYRRLESECRTTVDLGVVEGGRNVLVEQFSAVSVEFLGGVLGGRIE